MALRVNDAGRSFVVRRFEGPKVRLEPSAPRTFEPSAPRPLPHGWGPLFARWIGVPWEMDHLPAPVLANEHPGPETLVIDRALLVLPFGGGATRHDGGVSVERTCISSEASNSKSTRPVLRFFRYCVRVSTTPRGRMCR